MTTSIRAAETALDVLADAALLAAQFPEVPAEAWLVAATAGGADALGLGAFGRIVEGTAPGLLLLEGDTPLDALTAPRRWLAPARA